MQQHFWLQCRDECEPRPGRKQNSSGDNTGQMQGVAQLACWRLCRDGYLSTPANSSDLQAWLVRQGCPSGGCAGSHGRAGTAARPGAGNSTVSMGQAQGAPRCVSGCSAGTAASPGLPDHTTAKQATGAAKHATGTQLPWLPGVNIFKQQCKSLRHVIRGPPAEPHLHTSQHARHDVLE